MVFGFRVCRIRVFKLFQALGRSGFRVLGLRALMVWVGVKYFKDEMSMKIQIQEAKTKGLREPFG